MKRDQSGPLNHQETMKESIRKLQKECNAEPLPRPARRAPIFGGSTRLSSIQSRLNMTYLWQDLFMRLTFLAGTFEKNSWEEGRFRRHSVRLRARSGYIHGPPWAVQKFMTRSNKKNFKRSDIGVVAAFFITCCYRADLEALRRFLEERWKIIIFH